MPSEILNWLVLVVFVVLGAIVVRRAGGDRIGHRTKLALALFSLAVLVVVTATDWPSESLSQFWAEHSILTSVLTTVLLVGAGLLAFDARDERRQREIDDSITAAGLGGLVETMADIDFVLTALLTTADVQQWSGRAQAPRKPLRWVRDWRAAIDDEGETDPRSLAQIVPSAQAAQPGWERTAEGVVTECLRRLSGGLRDWAPLLTRSKDGRASLVRAARVRLLLMEIEKLDDIGRRQLDVDTVWDRARAESRILARGFEIASGAIRPRAFVCSRFDDLRDDKAHSLAQTVLSGLPKSGQSSEARSAARVAYLGAPSTVVPDASQHQEVEPSQQRTDSPDQSRR